MSHISPEFIRPELSDDSDFEEDEASVLSGASQKDWGRSVYGKRARSEAKMATSKKEVFCRERRLPRT